MEVFSKGLAYRETIEIWVIYLQKENSYRECIYMNFCSWSFPGYWICLFVCAVGSGAQFCRNKKIKSAILAGKSASPVFHLVKKSCL